MFVASINTIDFEMNAAKRHEQCDIKKINN